MKLWPLALLAFFFIAYAPSARAESQENEYKGITDPFGDPANYEFAEDEKEDKEFFHLGRYFMLGVDLGAGVYTGGLGLTNSPGFYFGAHMIYFFDKSLALEIAGHFADSLDSIHPNNTQYADIDTNLIPVTLGLRYYFDTQNAPKAIAIANPYIVAGAGGYFRVQTVLDQSGLNLTSTSGTNFGAFAGAGLEFAIYHKHLYLGVDGRFHYVLFTDSSDTFGGVLQPGARAGNYFTAALSLTYSF